MILDKLLELSSAQAITANAVSTNVIDLSQSRDIGEGENLYVAFNINTAFAGGTSLQADIVTADDAGLTTNAVVIGSTGAIPTAQLNSGASPVVRLNPIIGEDGARYVGVKYTVVGTFTAGAISANVTHGIQDGKKNYKSGFSVK